MRLNLLLAALCGLAAVAGSVQATFSASPGFSGRAGQTCTACHHPASPTHDDAQAVLEGLPAAWSLGETYALTVRVTGGPPALPAPQPQGGMDLASDGGSFSIPAAMAGKLRTVGPLEVTYTPEGTLQREWQVEWTSPTLAQRPAPVGFWLAVLAANGNHVVATNTSDQGETLDAAASLHVTVPPEAAALDAWRALPLGGPSASLRQEGAVVAIEGHHADGNATRIAWRLDGGAWTERATGTQWLLRFQDLPAGAHELAYRSEGDDRRSAEQTLTFRIDGAGQVAPSHAAPASFLLTLVPLFLALRRRP